MKTKRDRDKDTDTNREEEIGLVFKRRCPYRRRRRRRTAEGDTLARSQFNAHRSNYTFTCAPCRWSDSDR